MFKSPRAQWEIILTKPLKKQSKFLNKICYVNRRDNLILRGAFFENLSFSLVRKIFKMVKDIVEVEEIDFSLRELIFDRLLWVSEIAHLYPIDRNAEENIIAGEGYHVYSACYYDLDLINTFLNSKDDINSAKFNFCHANTFGPHSRCKRRQYVTLVQAQVELFCIWRFKLIRMLNMWG